MATLDPAVAAIRQAVRRAVPTTASGVLVACSGGPDSMALAAAAAFVLPRAGVHSGLVTVDHQLQPGSAERAGEVVRWAASVGLAPAVVATVDVGRTGGPEAAARDARYEALVHAAVAHGCDTVLLGHTRDDQAETVLLALLRGAGGRGLAGMPPVRGSGEVALVRPLLDISRKQTRQACTVLGLPTWQDPHNTDPTYRRTHARALLGELVDRLGPAVVGNLATTARLAAADVEALDQLAADAAGKVTAADGSVRVAELADLPAAVRTRVLHVWSRGLGVPGSALSQRHVAALDALIVDWHGQGAVWLPGGIAVVRRRGHLHRIEAAD
jgi:tRNA(Ile)-lysidine synthase